jgi:hypothetical protein
MKESLMASEVDCPDLGNGRHGSVFSVSGPVIIAENMSGCCMYELVSITGPSLSTILLTAFSIVPSRVRPVNGGGHRNRGR